MDVIYKPKGAAGEYASLACNLYHGCTGHCEYCYVPAILRQKPAAFHCDVTPKKAMYSRLYKDCIILKRGPYQGPVFFSFTCDPYQPIEREKCITREALKILNAFGLNWTILTKFSLARRDFHLYGPGDSFGVSLTLLSPRQRLQWEPGADSASARLRSLQDAHELGIRTWVSLEPVISPTQSLDLIRIAAPYTDEFKIGKLNHHPLAAKIDWTDFAVKAVNLCRDLGKAYHVKKALQVYLPPTPEGEE